MPSGELKRFSVSLRALIVLTVALGVSGAAVLAYLDQAATARDEYVAEIETEVSRLANLLALALREPMWQFVPEQAESIIDAAFVNPEVFSIEVHDHKGIQFAARNKNGSILQEQSVREAREIERDGVVLGQLEIVMSTVGYQQKLNASRQQFMRSALIVLIVSLLIILLVMHFSFVNPVKRLVAASEKIARGNLQFPIARVHSMELGTLARSLESTRLALIQLFAEIEEQNRALADSNEHLEQRVAERTHSLEEALATLQRAQEEIVQTEKLASLGRVVAGVAHELNTPIGNALAVATTIEAYLGVLESEYREGSLKRSTLDNMVEECHRGLPIFIRNIERAAQLISNFKQVAIDQTSDQRRKFDLASVTSEVLMTLEPTLRKNSCWLQTQLEEGIQCDSYPGAYGQVLTNLVMNAMQHGYSEGQKGRITITVRALEGEKVELTVSDDGKGMTEDVKQRIFDPFFTTRLGTGGSGLGMNIVHGLVARVLGGSISISSEPGMGARIMVHFKTQASQ